MGINDTSPNNHKLYLPFIIGHYRSIPFILTEQGESEIQSRSCLVQATRGNNWFQNNDFYVSVFYIWATFSFLQSFLQHLYIFGAGTQLSQQLYRTQ